MEQLVFLAAAVAGSLAGYALAAARYHDRVARFARACGTRVAILELKTPTERTAASLATYGEVLEIMKQHL